LDVDFAVTRKQFTAKNLPGGATGKAGGKGNDEYNLP